MASASNLGYTRGTPGPILQGFPHASTIEKISGEKKYFRFVCDNFYFLFLTTFHRRGNLVLESERRGEENLTPTFWKKYETQRFQRRRELVLNRPRYQTVGGHPYTLNSTYIRSCRYSITNISFIFFGTVSDNIVQCTC